MKSKRLNNVCIQIPRCSERWMVQGYCPIPCEKVMSEFLGGLRYGISGEPK